MVVCYAGSRYPERPRSFLWQGKWLQVEAVEQQWRTPDCLVFRIRAAGNRRFRLTYRQRSDTWDIVEERT